MYFMSRQYNGKYVIVNDESGVYAFDLTMDEVEAKIYELDIEKPKMITYDIALELIFESTGRDGVQQYIKQVQEGMTA